MTELSARSRRGVVVAPHFLAVEAGREVLAEGGNAHRGGDRGGGGDRPRLSAHESYRRRRLLDHSRALGAYPLHRSLRLCRRQGDAGALCRAWLQNDPGARAARGTHGSGRHRRLDAGAAMPPRRWAARCRCRDFWSRPSRIARKGSPVSRSMSWRLAYERATDIEAPGFAETFLIDGKPPKEGTILSTGTACRHARAARQGRPRRFLSRRRRPRDRRRPRTDRQPGDARGPRKLSRRPARAAFDQAEGGHGPYFAAADPGPRHASYPWHLRAAAGRPRPKASLTFTAFSKRRSAPSRFAIGS